MRSRRVTRCPDCRLSQSLCCCALFPLVSVRTRVVVLAHRVELTRSTNTGRLVARMLGASAELVSSDAPWEGSPLPRNAWVLFPSEDAAPLEAVASQLETLVVPDGSWGQAKRIARRHPICKGLRPVRLSNPGRSTYQLRRAPSESGLCTIEAVAQALRVLEGDAGPDAILAAFSLWLERAWLVRAGAHNLPERVDPG